MQTYDELRNEGGMAWRYICNCGYATTPRLKQSAALVQRIHRHRHRMGLAGIYHRPEDRT